jgi:nucleoid-associated protein YgaU
MISTNSRYKTATLTTEEVDGKSIIYIIPPTPQVTVFQYSYYTITFADRIDSIANTYLGNPVLWYLIANVNPQIMDWLNLQPGTVIRIPQIATVS